MQILFFLLLVSRAMAIDPEFVSLSDLCPRMLVDASYSTTENFTGEIVRGYKAKKAYMAKGPAEALCRVQKAAELQGYTLKIFDAFRPVKAITFFQEWAKKPETNPRIKELFYPKFTRQELFELGYIAKQSSHSRGGAVDLTLYDLKNKNNLDMGSGFDYFDELSNTDSQKITAAQRKNRQILRDLMEVEGFKNFSQEWWHYSFKPEPFPNRTFDFDIE